MYKRQIPSRWELSPLTPLEGFAFKKPVISTRSHGIPFTIQHDKNGILVDGFKGHSVGDVINSDYLCAIDIEKNEFKSLALYGPNRELKLVKNYVKTLKEFKNKN